MSSFIYHVAARYGSSPGDRHDRGSGRPLRATGGPAVSSPGSLGLARWGDNRRDQLDVTVGVGRGDAHHPDRRAVRTALTVVASLKALKLLLKTIGTHPSRRTSWPRGDRITQRAVLGRLRREPQAGVVLPAGPRQAGRPLPRCRGGIAEHRPAPGRPRLRPRPGQPTVRHARGGRQLRRVRSARSAGRALPDHRKVRGHAPSPRRRRPARGLTRTRAGVTTDYPERCGPRASDAGATRPSAGRANGAPSDTRSPSVGRSPKHPNKAEEKVVLSYEKTLHKASPSTPTPSPPCSRPAYEPGSPRPAG